MLPEPPGQTLIAPRRKRSHRKSRPKHSGRSSSRRPSASKPYPPVVSGKPATMLWVPPNDRLWPKGNWSMHESILSFFILMLLRISGLLELYIYLFAAIAELLDNGVDEIQNGATFVSVDKIDLRKDNSPALLFRDDGGGMNPEGLRKCMSLGYSTKKSNTTIGQYGNGFKTSTMRLGADAIVFSRATRGSKATQSIGLLSYTFLRKTGQDDVIVPMIDFDISGNWVEPIIYSSQDDWSSNLKIILEWSPFGSKEDLLQQFEDIGAHGTKIIMYNLWLNDEGVYELSFDDDDEDIRLRDEANHGSLTKLNKKTVDILNHVSYRFRYSLRAYASILYLRKFTNFQVIIRGKPVQKYDIQDDLIHVKVITYRPRLATISTEWKQPLDSQNRHLIFQLLGSTCTIKIASSGPFGKSPLMVHRKGMALLEFLKQTL